MKKFNKLFKIGTKVKINGEWYSVSKIHSSKQWINVTGLTCSIQRGHVEKFTNKGLLK